ncbi:MAG: ABC transporter substrate-binding protein [Flavobacteriales bacterium]|nr:ABC transporter substrate-binding protein [Flavobacteriales bacterium]MBK9534506.1 ABC transporter substrate-binding protein [Flavobacteriales bacterium]MBP9139629.1 ABC transporter substrate-binding protein [Flavobacteriales bacterium]HQX31396.1 ABC transporter substrate-binding protein [Flavobacteriales bacterium]HQX39534.1 ABC transporter substrate-binding protein [Flavobacteriales bacterium]
MNGQPPIPEGLTTIRLAGVPEPFNLPWILALERRAFVRAKIDVKWQTVPQGTGEMCKMLHEDQVDMAVLVTEGAVRDILLGSPTRIVTTLVDSPLTWGVHVGSGTTVSDLKQMPFAISRFNSGSHLMATVYAKKNGRTLTEKDFIIVNDLAGAVERLKSKEPALFLWEKAMTASYVHKGLFNRVDEITPDWPAFVVVAREGFLKDNSDAVARLMRVFRDQAKGFQEKKNAADIIASRYGMTPDNAAEWNRTLKWNLDGAVDVNALHGIADSLHQAGILDEKPTEEAVVRCVAPLAMLK